MFLFKKKFFFKKFLKKKIFLSMIPYPSGKLHIGHVRNYIINDIYNRYNKLLNINVFSSIGWDSFGTPAENISFKKFIIPFKWVYNNIYYMKKQLKLIEFFISWKYELLTCKYNFYKISQFFINKFIFKNFIIFRKKILNWDCFDKIVLSNEQVSNGLSWRNNFVKLKNIKTFFLKIFNYKSSLLKDLNNLNWNKNIKIMQKNWIIKFKFIKFYFFLFSFFKYYFYKKLNFSNYHNLKENFFFFIFKNNYFLEFLNKKKYFKIFFFKKIKFNFFYKDFKFINIGINFFTLNKNIEIWFYSNLFIFKKFLKKNFCNKKIFFKNFLNINKFYFFEFLNKNINIFFCLNLNLYLNYFNKINFIILKFNNIFYLYNFWNIKNWNFSRKKYWGNIFNLLYCMLCDFYINKNFLLPKKIKPNYNFNSLNNDKFLLKNFCLNCLNKSIKNFETLDTFFDSSWYFFYYIYKISKNLNKYLNIDFYVGGIEHAVLHLLYSRFIIKFLKDLKFIIFNEPIKNLFTQGMVLNYTYYIKNNSLKKWLNYKDIYFIKKKNKLNYFYKKNNKKVFLGKIEKMSKSKNNGINPLNFIKNYNLDILKISVISYSSLNNNIIWSDKNVLGFKSFLIKFFKFFKKNFLKNNLYKNNLIKLNFKLILKNFYINLIKINFFYKKINFNTILIKFIKIFNFIKNLNIKNFLINNDLKLLFFNFIYPILPKLCKKLSFKNKLNFNFLFKFKYIKLKNIFFKYILFIFNKKFGIFFIKKIFLIKKIKNLIFFKNIIKFNLILSKNIINLI